VVFFGKSAADKTITDNGSGGTLAETSSAMNFTVN
jgi:hypothetical protein